MRERAHRQEVHAGLRVGRGVAQGEPAGGLQEGAPPDDADRLRALLGGEVVQQDEVGARVHDLAELVQGVDLDLDGDLGEASRTAEGLGDAARGDHVVVLDQGRVGQGHPVVDAAAAADRELLQGPQPRRGLAGVAHAGRRTLQRVPQARGRRSRCPRAGTAG